MAVFALSESKPASSYHAVHKLQPGRHIHLPVVLIWQRFGEENPLGSPASSRLFLLSLPGIAGAPQPGPLSSVTNTCNV
jgi:hypothetical protein